MIGLLLLLIGCQKKTVIQEETKQDNKSSAIDDIGFDPLELPRDKEIIPVKYPKTGDVLGDEELVETSPNSIDTISHILKEIPSGIDSLNNQSYRIQIFTTKVYGEARSALKVAEEIFDRPIFLDYEVPYYKVRVGNFNDKEKAEEYQLRAKAAGYSDAWVVMVNVNVKETAPLYDDILKPMVPDTLKIEENNDSNGQ